MRILHVMSWFVPNMGYQENVLTLEQRQLGHEVAVVCGASVPESCKAVPEFYGMNSFPYGHSKENGVDVYRLPSVDVRSLSLIFGLTRAIDKFDPDIVHAHGAMSPATFVVLLMKRRRGYKLFIDEHGLGLEGTYSRTVDRVYARMCRYAYRLMDDRVACFLPVTHSSWRMLRVRLGIAPERMDLLPLGADVRRFDRDRMQRDEARNELGVTDDQILFLSSGKFTEEKLVHVLVRSFKDVVKKTPNVRLLLLGCGMPEYMARLDGLVTDLGLREQVRFHGFVPNSELSRFYNAADVGVWPGSPSITALEAASVGLPLVIPSDEPAYNMLLESSSAVGYKRGDCQSLAEVLRALVIDKERRISIGDSAYSVIRREMSWERIALKSVTLYASRE